MERPAETSNLEKINAKRIAYKNVFEGEDGLLVLNDLRQVCFGKTTTAHELPHIMGLNEGQRTVLLHIETMLALEPVQLEQLGEDNEG